jgi:hypothetical protein
MPATIETNDEKAARELQEEAEALAKEAKVAADRARGPDNLELAKHNYHKGRIAHACRHVALALAEAYLAHAEAGAEASNTRATDDEARIVEQSIGLSNHLPDYEIDSLFLKLEKRKQSDTPLRQVILLELAMKALARKRDYFGPVRLV